MYRLDNYNYPKTDQGLNVLVKPLDSNNTFSNVYIKRLPKDPWGNDYQYLSPGDNGVYDTNKWTTVLGKINGNINSEQDVYKTFDFSETYAGKRVAIDFTFWEFGTWEVPGSGKLQKSMKIIQNR